MSVSKCIYSYNLSEEDVGRLPTLHRFVWKGKLHKVLSVLSDSKKKNKVNKKDYNQRTPSHLAASRGDVKMLQFLLSIDTKSMNCLDSDGRTAFYKACQVLSLECMQVLVSHGSRTVCIDFKKCSIMERLVIETGDGSLKCLEYLIAKQPVECKLNDNNKAFHTAVKYGRIGVVKMFIQLGLDVNAVDKGTGKIYNLLSDYDNSNDVLDDPSRNKVFVTFHKTPTMETQQKQDSVFDQRKNDLLTKIKELEKEIEMHKNDLNESKERNNELQINLKLQNEREKLKKSSNQQASSNPQSTNEIAQRPKVILKKLFKSGYKSKEEWALEFDQLVEDYDELQRAFGKLLLVESEKEYEIEECLEMIEKGEIEKEEDQKKVNKLKMELRHVQEDIAKIAKEKAELQAEINEMKTAVSKEKLRFKSVIEQANKLKNQFLNTIDQLKLKKKQKMEELIPFVDEESELLAEIENCDHVISEQKKRRNKIVNKIKSLKNKITEEVSAKNRSE